MEKFTSTNINSTFLVLFLLFFSIKTTLSAEYKISLLSGSTITSFSNKNEETITDPEILAIQEEKAPKEKTISQIPLTLSVEYFLYNSWSHLISFDLPLIDNEDYSLTKFSYGINFYPSGESLSNTIESTDFIFEMLRKRTLYWGATVGLISFSYPSLENDLIKRSNDMVFEIGPHVGYLIPITPKWDLKTEVGVYYGFGVNNTFFPRIRISLGGAYQF